MQYAATLQDMSLEQLVAVIEVLQKSSDSYFYILDLDTDTYIITQKMMKRFPFPNTVVEHASETFQTLIYPSDLPKLTEDIHRCATGQQNVHEL